MGYPVVVPVVYAIIFCGASKPTNLDKQWDVLQWTSDGHVLPNFSLDQVVGLRGDCVGKNKVAD